MKINANRFKLGVSLDIFQSQCRKVLNLIERRDDLEKRMLEMQIELEKVNHKIQDYEPSISELAKELGLENPYDEV